MAITIREIDHVVLRVREAPRMLDFYCRVLGCTLDRRNDEIGLIQLRAGASLIDLVPVESPLGQKGGAPPRDEGHNVDHVCFRLVDFDPEAIASHLKAHGVEPGPVEARYGAEGLGPSIYVADPEGNTVELKGPPDRRGTG